MKPDAQIADRSFLPRRRACFGHGQEAVARELAPRPAKIRRASDPDDRLQIAQTTRTFLDVRLEVVRGVVILEMALLLLERLRVVERAHVE